MIKTSEAFDSARSEYIEGYEEKNEYIFPTLSLVAKEFNISLSTLRKKAAIEGYYVNYNSGIKYPLLSYNNIYFVIFFNNVFCK